MVRLAMIAIDLIAISCVQRQLGGHQVGPLLSWVRWPTASQPKRKFRQSLAQDLQLSTAGGAADEWT